MSACKICNQPSNVKTVSHTACRDELMEVMCDDYCRWPREVRSQAELDEKCSICKIVELLGKEG